MTDDTTIPAETPARPQRGVAGSIARVAAWAAGLQALAWGALWVAFGVLKTGYAFFAMSDITYPYIAYAQNLWQGMAAYRDFTVEYPPLFVPLLYAGGDPNSQVAFVYRFAATMVLFMIGAGVVTAMAAMTAENPRRAYVVGALYAGFVLLLGPISANRYDPVVALVFAAGLLLMLRGRWVWSAAVLGIGFALKITPALLFPLLLVLMPSKRIWPALGAFTAAALAPFVWLVILGGKAHSAIVYVFAYHLSRPLEVESVLAMPLWVGRLVGSKLTVVNAFGSQAIDSGAAQWLGRLSAPLLLGSVIAIAWLVARRREAVRSNPRLIALAALATILGSLVASKVLSPQYFVWIVPAVALVAPDRKGIGVLLGGAFLLTQVLFPGNYWAFAQFQIPAAVEIVLARNALLVAAFVWSVVDLARIPAETRKPAEPAEPAANAEPAAEAA